MGEKKTGFHRALQLGQETRLKTIIIFAVPFGDARDAETTCKKMRLWLSAAECLWSLCVNKASSLRTPSFEVCDSHVILQELVFRDVFEVERCDDTLIQPRVFSSSDGKSNRRMLLLRSLISKN